MLDEKVLKKEEEAIFALRSLYKRYGYVPFKMSKFEEYDLYVGNKDFLVSDRVITFNDTDGRLLALKPDVTLSIIKHTADEQGIKHKVFYNENVYRVSGTTGQFKEIMQMGLELIGDTDVTDVFESVSLAAASLAEVSSDFVLDISHMGILSFVLDRIGISENGRRALLECVSKKDLHDAERICREEGIDAESAALLSRLENCSGTADNALQKLKFLFDDDAWRAMVARFENILALLPTQNIRVDFSVINDMNYYNGIVFQGFVPGIPTDVLSGGQYDNLMARMEKKSGAIGFAIYLDRLETLVSPRRDFDVDALLLYGDQDSSARILSAVQSLTEQGLCVVAQRAIPERLTYRQLLKLTESGVETIETNA